MKGKRLDLSSEANPSNQPASAEQGQGDSAQSYLGVKFECCSVYTRIYKNQAGDAYEGRCPRCAKPIRLPIGPGGTDSRFFTAS